MKTQSRQPLPAAMVRSRAPQASRPHSGVTVCPVNPRATVGGTQGLTDIQPLDALRLYPDPATALGVIERQLAIQSADMEPAAVKRCQRAADEIRYHLWAEAEKLCAEAEAAALAARIAAARNPGKGEHLEAGTQIALGRYLATITGCRMQKNGAMTYSATLTHSRAYRAGYSPIGRRDAKSYKALRADEFLVLPPPAEPAAEPFPITTLGDPGHAEAQALAVARLTGRAPLP